MPTIPIYHADLQQRSDAPAKVSDTDAARIPGQAISQFGEGMSNLGNTLLAQQRAQEKTKDDLDANGGIQDVRTLSLQAKKDAYLNASEDFSNLGDLYKQSYDKSVTEYLKTKNVSASAYGKIQVGAKDIYNDTLGTITTDQIKGFQENANKRFEESLNKESAWLVLNPGEYDKSLAKYTELVNGSAYTDQMKAKILNLSKKKLSDSAINGYKQAHEWDAARFQLNSKFAGIYDSKEIEQHLDDIQTTEINYTKSQIQANDRTIKDLAAQKKIINTKMVRDTLEMINGARTMTGPDRVQALKEAEDMIDERVAAGDLEMNQAAAMKSQINRDAKDTQNSNMIPYYDRFYKAQNVKQLDALSADLNNNLQDVPTDRVLSLMGMIDSERNRMLKTKKGVGSAKMTNELKKNALDYIKAQSGFDPTRGFMKVENANIYEAASHEFLVEYYKNPKWRADPWSLAEKINEKYNWDNEKDPRINRLKSTEDPSKSMNEAKRLYDKQKISAGEAADIIESAEKRMAKEAVKKKKGKK